MRAAPPPDELPQLLSTSAGDGGNQWRTLADLQTAAAADQPAACFQLGLRYETGDGVTRNYQEARALYEKAAAGGVAAAIYRMGKLWQEGLGTDPDPGRAWQCYRIAAYAGVPLAQYNLGAMLVSARGVIRDDVEGLAWLILATHNHVDGDGEKRVRLHLAGQPQTIAAAEKRADELGREITTRRGAKPPWPLPPDDSPVPSASKPAPKVEKPEFEPPKVAPPKFEPPPRPPPDTPQP